MNALELRNQVRRQARATGAGRIRNCIVGEMSALRGDRDQAGLRNRLRLSEIERVIRHRHGQFLPDARGTDDLPTVVAYLRAAALTGTGINLKSFCARYAPWALDESFLAELEGERIAWRERSRRPGTMLPADAVAKMIGVTAAERAELGLRTIGASDQTKAKRLEEAKAKKRQRDRERQAVKRRAAGATSRAESVAQTKPWEAEGISRSTWYERRRTDPSLITAVGILQSEQSVRPTEECGETAAGASSSSIIDAPTPQTIHDHDDVQNIATAKREAQGLQGQSPWAEVQEAEPRGASDGPAKRWTSNTYAIAKGLVDA